MPEDAVTNPAAPAQTEYQKWASLPESDQDAVSSAAEPAQAEPEAKTEPASEPEASQESEEEKQLPSGLKKRFRELTTKIRNLEAAAAKPAAEPAKVETKVETPPAKVEATPQGAAKPESKDFESYEAYVEKLVEWQADQRELARQRKATEESQAAETRQRAEAWDTELKAARERYADFDAVALSDMPINRATHETIVNAGKDGAELAYYLGQHRDEAAAICKLSPIPTQLALGKILAKLESSTPETNQPAAVTRAPRPPQTAKGSGGPDPGKEPDPKDFAKWSKWKDRQEALEDA